MVSVPTLHSKLIKILSIYFFVVKSEIRDYKGALIGKFNSYAHQVSGEVFAVDEFTFYIKEFFYDGLANGKEKWNPFFLRFFSFFIFFIFYLRESLKITNEYDD